MSKNKERKFLISILSLVIGSIIVFASIKTYPNIKMFQSYIEDHIQQSLSSRRLTSDRKDSLIKRADDASYKAKQNGRNRVEVSTPIL